MDADEMSVDMPMTPASPTKDQLKEQLAAALSATKGSGSKRAEQISTVSDIKFTNTVRYGSYVNF